MKAYKLADWAIYPETNGIVRGDSTKKLESRVMQMLVYFCENPGRVISRDELMDAIWGTRDLSENSVSVAIRAIRKALGDDAQNPRYIETHQKLGYRLLVKPRVLDSRAVARWRARLLVGAAVVLGLTAALIVSWSLWPSPDADRPDADAQGTRGADAGDRSAGDPGARRTVITLDGIDNATGLAEHDELTAILGDLVIAELAQNEAITVRKTVPDVLTDALTVDLGTGEQVTSITGRLLAGEDGLHLMLYLEGDGSGEVLWATNRSIARDDLLADTRLISRELMASLGLEAGIEGELGRETGPGGDATIATNREQARELYQRARSLAAVVSNVTIKLAHGLLLQAIELDPAYGPAHGLLAEMYSWFYPASFWGLEGDMFDHAERELSLARRYGADEAYILVTQAGIHLSRDRRYDLSKELLDRALELRPGDPWVLRPRIWTSMLFGDFDAALADNLRAAEVSLDPSSVLAERVVPLYYSGRFQEAHDLHRATVELGLKPTYQGPQAAMMLGDQVEGFRSWVEFIRLQGVEIEDESEAVQWATDGDLRSAYDWLRERSGSYTRNWSFALMSAGWHEVAGDRELAVEEAASAILRYRTEFQPTGMPGYEWSLFVYDPLFAELRKDPRIVQVLPLLDMDSIAGKIGEGGMDEAHRKMAE